MKEEEMLKVKIGAVLGIVVLFLALATSAASATTVTIQSAQVGVSESITVPIMINDVTGVKGAHILLEFNSSVVNALTIGNSAFAIESFKEINNASGYVRYTVFSMSALNGDVKFADVTLQGMSAGSSPLNLTVVSLSNGSAEIPRDVINGTFTVLSDTEPPVVVNPAANPAVIPEDTDDNPTWGEVAELTVNVTDESGIDTVTINLSDLGWDVSPMVNQSEHGPGVAVMFCSGNYSANSTTWILFNFSTNASNGTANWNGTAYVPYCLPVNATDFYKHSNSSICITLTVMKNGDVDENGAVNLNDGIYLANYALLVPGYALKPQLADVDESHGPPNLNDGIYLANHALFVPGYGVLH